MVSQAPHSPADAQPSAAIKEFAALHYEVSGAQAYAIDRAELAALLAEVVSKAKSGELDESAFLASLHLEELVLARACANGSERAWEVFLTRYRTVLYDAAYGLFREASAGRELADSMYYELYVSAAEGKRRSKLDYYYGRGSLGGWLRVVVKQEYFNRSRKTKRETSLDDATEEGEQFAAPEPEAAPADTRLNAAVSEALGGLDPDDRLVLSAYFLDGRTLAQIAKLLGVHESTISRKLERIISRTEKETRKLLIKNGMSRRQAEEAMADVDVRDLQVRVAEIFSQERQDATFYKDKGKIRDES